MDGDKEFMMLVLVLYDFDIMFATRRASFFGDFFLLRRFQFLKRRPFAYSDFFSIIFFSFFMTQKLTEFL